MTKISGATMSRREATGRGRPAATVKLDCTTDASRKKPANHVGWLERPIGEIAEIFDGPHATPAKTEKGPIFLGISNLSQGRLNLAEAEHISDVDYVRWTRRVVPQPGDVLFSYETRLGDAARVPNGMRCCLGRRMGLLRARKAEASITPARRRPPSSHPNRRQSSVARAQDRSRSASDHPGPSRGSS